MIMPLTERTAFPPLRLRGMLREFFQTVKLLLVQLIAAGSEGVAQPLIKMQCVDGGWDHNARRAKKHRVVLDRLNERAAHAAPLLLRQNENRVKAALSRVFVIRAT